MRLAECHNILLGEQVKGTTFKLVEQIIHECVKQASDLAQKKDLDNAERSRLLDIMFWSSELGKRLEGTPKTK